MDEETAQRLKGLLLASISWADNEWAQDMFEALVDGGLTGPPPTNIESEVYNAVHNHVLGVRENLDRAADDDKREDVMVNLGPDEIQVIVIDEDDE
jgi:hypothetical protein